MVSQNTNQGGLEETNEVNAVKNRRMIQRGNGRGLGTPLFNSNRGFFRGIGTYTWGGLGNQTKCCFRCGEPGHLAATCPNSPKNMRGGGGRNNRGGGANNNPQFRSQPYKVPGASSALSIAVCGAGLVAATRPIYLSGRGLKGLIDTGASVNFLDEKVARKLKIWWDPS